VKKMADRDYDIGTEELGHLEMVGAIVHQLTRNMREEDVKAAGLETYFVDHTAGVYPTFASGTPWTAATMQVSGDTIADLTENMAAEQKARKTMTTSCGYRTTRTSTTPSGSCASAKSSITSASARAAPGHRAPESEEHLRNKSQLR
jgi:hypothetical protein